MTEVELAKRCCSGKHGKLKLAAAIFALLSCIAVVIALVTCTLTTSCHLLSNQQSSSAQSGAVTEAAVRRSTESCPVQYKSGSDLTDQVSVNFTQPLLFGGYYDRCSAGCQSRQDEWGQRCKLDPTSKIAWGLCETWQRPRILQEAMKIDNGALMQFGPCDMYPYLGNRTLWLIGDSHMKSFYFAIRCFLMDFWDHNLGECAASNSPLLQLQLHTAALFPQQQQNLTQLTKPRCILHQDLMAASRVCFIHTVRGEMLISDDPEKPGVLQLLQEKFASLQDVFYITFGRWYVHACIQFEQSTYEASIQKLADYYQANKQTWPYMVFSVPPYDHTCSAPEGTVWDASMEKCFPFVQENESMVIGRKIASVAEHAFSREGVPVIDNYNFSIGMQDAHISVERSFQGKQDCLHFCRPGLPEMDIWYLYESMKSLDVSQAGQSAEGETPTYPCTPVANI